MAGKTTAMMAKDHSDDGRREASLVRAGKGRHRPSNQSEPPRVVPLHPPQCRPRPYRHRGESSAEPVERVALRPAAEQLSELPEHRVLPITCWLPRNLKDDAGRVLLVTVQREADLRDRPASRDEDPVTIDPLARDLLDVLKLDVGRQAKMPLIARLHQLAVRGLIRKFRHHDKASLIGYGLREMAEALELVTMSPDEGDVRQPGRPEPPIKGAPTKADVAGLARVIPREVDRIPRQRVAGDAARDIRHRDGTVVGVRRTELAVHLLKPRDELAVAIVHRITNRPLQRRSLDVRQQYGSAAQSRPRSSQRS